MKFVLGLALGAWACAAQTTGSIRGSVVDAQGGEPLARVEIQLAGSQYRTVTGAAGEFAIEGIAPGSYTLNASTVGYRPVRRPFQLAAGESQEFEIILSPGTLRQTTTVDVKADPFEPSRQDSPSQMVLQGNDLKNLASVLADDPLRAVQGLPGVASNDDFDARISLRGADYRRLGLYLDGVLLHMPFHTIQGTNGATGSATSFNNDMVESIELHSGAFPVRFSDRTAGALDVHTRDGSRTGNSFRATASASNAGLTAEGPLGKHGSWLAGGRKSYLQYILARTSSDSSIAFGLWDTQARVTYDLTPHHNVSLNVLEGESDLDRSSARSRLGANSIMGASYHYTLANLAWRYAPTERLLVVNRGAYVREKFDDFNSKDQQLGAGHYGEWVWSTTATWMWNERNPLEVGYSARRLRDEGFSNQAQFTPLLVRRLNDYSGTALRSGGYAQQSWMVWAGRLHLTAGGRWDRHTVDAVNAFNPQASVGVTPWKGTRFQLGWGQNAQYPELPDLFSRYGRRSLIPERSTHTIAAVEQRLGARTRVRLEAYNRTDRDLLFRPLYEPRLVAGKIYNPLLDPPALNSQRGYARGVEVFVQTASANRLTGWASYSLGYTRIRDGIAKVSYPADYDQRHTVNVYGSYRLRPTVNLSVRWLYGSGFPVPGFLRLAGSTYFLAAERNALRLEAYQRLDVRVNKSWMKARWKVTLYGEAVNVTNRRNRRFDSFNGHNSRTGQASLTFDRMFPILPSLGIVFER